MVVAWDLGSGSEGRLRALEAAPPFAFAGPEVATDGDGILRVTRGRVLHLSRASGVLSVIDAITWSVIARHALDPAQQPRDVLAVDADTAYVTRKAATRLLRLELQSGDVTESVDLSPLADSDGIPEMERMAVHDGRLFVQIRRESDLNPPFERPAGLAVIDLASEQLVDADPLTPGVQAIALAGTPPRFAMQVIPETRELFVSATGAFHDAGGLERVDLDGLVSLGLVVLELGGDVGADLGAFVLTTPWAGWLSFSTDLLLSSHLHRFSTITGVDPFEAHFALHYFTPRLVHEPVGDRLFWPEPEGVHVFDATSGSRLTTDPIAIAGVPTDLALIPAPAGIPALPGGSLGFALFAGLLGAAALLLAGPRRRRRP